jgi:hypothetical protein
MTLNVVQVCQAKYPGEVEKLNISFRQSQFDIFIETWNVAGVERPTEAELLAEAPQYEAAYNLMIFMQIGQRLVQDTIDDTAKSRQYKNGVYCASYAQSTNPVWAAEAQAFIAWRDSIFAYALQVFSDIQGGQPAPTQEEFVAGFPSMVWPE